ncbi:MAG: chorismate mutase [Caldilineaceae bacterium]|nr:chorismate mutase [Caldilineaceae bacterium]
MIPPEACTTIEEVRSSIDELDRVIITALGQRFHYVKAVTRFKKNADDVRAPARYLAVLQSRRAWAEEVGLNPDVIEAMYRHLIEHFIDEEMKLVHHTG